ncbi:MAG: hypothetical protein LBQ75_01950 [Zoogloeaceae bacterium]|nr:hypothetical protein [Zoogloeaceae bacterium]
MGVCLSAAFVPTTAFAGDFYIAPSFSNFELKRDNATFRAGNRIGGTAVGGTYSGTMTGITLGWISDRDVFRMKFNYSSASGLDHKGEDINGRSYKNGGESITQYSGDMAFGGNFKIAEKFSVSPYIGLGFNDMNEKDNGKDPYWYDREHKLRTQYFMFGADWHFVPAESWKVSLNTQLDYLSGGQTKISGNSHEYEHKSGSGYKISAKGEKDFKSVKLFLEPYYQKWEIGKSKSETAEGCTDATTVWTCYATYYYADKYIPKSTVTELGLRIGLAF